jgi:farnesyl-diphosphate farnesyltransferase
MRFDNPVALAAPEVVVDEFYDAHLRRVSRSFAFCIPRLRPRLRRQVASSYLLFRVADTIEDSLFAAARRDELFDAFSSLLEEPDVDGAACFAAAFEARATDAERLLIEDLPVLLADLQTFPVEARTAIVTTLRSMMNGMRYVLGAFGGELRLPDAGAVDLYCFFVAGLVGELLSRLVALDRGLTLDGPLLVDAHRFGRFLQKVNIIKDAASDRALGRELLPDGVEGSLRRDAEGALRYVLRLPPSCDDYRLFCAWSLFLGLFTVARSRNEDAASSRHEEVSAMLARIASIATDGRALTVQFERAAAALPPPDAPALRFVPDTRLRGVTTKLTLEQLGELGVVLQAGAQECVTRPAEGQKDAPSVAPSQRSAG